MLLPTIAAAVELSPTHETWVLDDGRRPAVERLATELGARYLTRPDNTHAKAGNINHALKYVEADVIAVLDADHVAHPDFLRHTLPYFDDPQVALVQTPQDFYNVDSFEHQDRGRKQVFNEQAIFYRVIAPGKNRWGGAFWCGTCALVRLEALREVGGVATETVTEDIHTTVRMHSRGWQTVYHNEVLARGLAARSLDEYLLQRNRWATGAMQVIRTQNPLTTPGLSFGQRLSYANDALGVVRLVAKPGLHPASRRGPPHCGRTHKRPRRDLWARLPWNARHSVLCDAPDGARLLPAAALDPVRVPSHASSVVRDVVAASTQTTALPGDAKRQPRRPACASPFPGSTSSSSEAPQLPFSGSRQASRDSRRWPTTTRQR